MNSALDFAFPATFPVKSSFDGEIRRGIPASGFGSRVRVCSLLPHSSSLKVNLFSALLLLGFLPVFRWTFCFIHAETQLSSVLFCAWLFALSASEMKNFLKFELVSLGYFNHAHVLVRNCLMMMMITSNSISKFEYCHLYVGSATPKS